MTKITLMNATTQVYEIAKVRNCFKVNKIFHSLSWGLSDLSWNLSSTVFNGEEADDINPYKAINIS